MNKISDLVNKTVNQRESITIRGILTKMDKRISVKKEDFLRLTLTDKEDSLDIFIWGKDKSDKVMESLNKGDLLEVKGEVGKYNENYNIQPVVSIVPKTDEDKSLYISSYSEIEIERAIKVVDDAIELLDEKHQKIIDKILNNEVYGQFAKCPASIKFHHNKIGGLVIHTAGVVTTVIGILKTLHYHPSYGSIDEKITVMAAILHDVCKLEEYEFDKGIFRKEHAKTDHRVNFLQYKNLLKEYLTIEETEKLNRLILSHHGAWGEYVPKCMEEHVLHYADMLDVMLESMGSENFDSLNYSIKNIIGFQK